MRLNTPVRERQTLEDKLQEHKNVARESLQYYEEMKTKCCKQWKEIIALDSNNNSKEIIRQFGASTELYGLGGKWVKNTPTYQELETCMIFLTIAVPPDKIVMKVCEKCYSESLHDSPTKVKEDFISTIFTLVSVVYIPKC